MDQSHCVPGEARWRPQEPGPGEPHMGTRVNSLVCGPEWDQRSLFKVRPRCGIEYPGPNGSWVRTRVTRAMQAQMGNRITRSW